MTTLIFVHGACVRDAQWWWAQMTRPLADHGITSVAVPLPSCGETGDQLGDLYADVDACREAVSAAKGPVVLCGHSYGGMVITEAGADDHVTQLLYVTSVMPDAGQSQAELIGSEPAPWLQPSEDGTIGVDPDMIREFFLQDCDESTTEQALDRLTRQSLTPFTQPPRQIAWQQKPATYFVCTGFLLARDPDTVRTPDAAFVIRERADRAGRVLGYWPGPPDLAVEVVSPADAYSELHDKALAWLAAGAQVVLVVDPAACRVTVYRSPADVRVRADDEPVDCSDILTGFALPASEFFPPRPATANSGS